MVDVPKSNEEMKKEEVIFQWKSPSRLFKKRDKEYFTNIGAIVFLLVVILFFAREYMFILAVLSIVFFIYVTSTVEPEEIEHKITNLGIESGDSFYRWGELVDFWYEEQWGQSLFVVQSLARGRIMMLLSKTMNKDKVREAVAQYVPYREHPQKTWMDNASRWISEKIPLEKPA